MQHVSPPGPLYALPPGIETGRPRAISIPALHGPASGAVRQPYQSIVINKGFDSSAQQAGVCQL